MRRGVALMVQVRRGYPARPGKTPEMPDWQPIYRFSRQRHADSPGIRERRARGRCGEPGGYSQPVDVGPGGRFGGRRLYLRGPGGGGGTLTDPSPTPKPVAAADCARVVECGHAEVVRVSGFQVGLGDLIVNSRYSPTAFARVDYLTAVASGVDSFWLGDHLNSLFPRSIATPRYLGVAKLIPKIDAALEPWTLLGHLASRNRFARLRLGVGVTDASRRNPAVTAQAAATLHLITRGRAILGIGVGHGAHGHIRGGQSVGVSQFSRNTEVGQQGPPLPGVVGLG